MAEINRLLGSGLVKRCNELPIPEGSVLVTYIWIDGTGINLRSKARTIETEPLTPKDVPVWTFDGSSCGQTPPGTGVFKSDLYLIPVAMFRDPFFGGTAKLVMCEVYNPDKKPNATNFRASCAATMLKARDLHPWFGFEQEYTMLDGDGHPLGWPKNGFPPPQGAYYCGTGANRVVARDIVDGHYRACLFAGVKVAGTNAEVMPAQWEFQVGPCEGIEMGDHLWVARWILFRLCENSGIVVTLSPKPIPGDWAGSGCHANFSTAPMREIGGMKFIDEAIEHLSKYQAEHIKVYDPSGGLENAKRLTGKNETAKITEFKSGTGDRSGSVRIPQHVADAGKGYLEDRRPSSDCDPYKVTEMLVCTCILHTTKSLG